MQNSERIKQFLVVVATAATIFFNYLAAIGWLGGITPGEVSDKYPTLITPAGYAFSIWSLIYTGLIAFSIYQFLPRNVEKFRTVRTVYILSCALNCAWLYFWHHEMISVATLLIFLLLGTLAVINSKLKTTETQGELWFVKFPFGLYFGWVTAASILNATIFLVYQNVQMATENAVRVGAGLILIATALGIIIRFNLNNVFYPLAIAWALTAIAVKQSGTTLIVASSAVSVNILIIVALTFLVKLPSSSDKNK